MTFGVHPFMLIAAFGALLALVAVIIACKARSGLVIALMLSFALVFLAPAGCVVLVLFPELVDGRFRTYKAFYHDIHAGMTRDQVLAAMERRYPAGGKRKRPTIMSNTSTNLSFFMNPETSREPNCEGIFLMLDGGRVTNVVYSPD